MLMRAAVLPWFAFGALSLAANAAAAEPGDHIRLGSGGEFVPSLSVAGVYRTNNYLTVGSRFGDSEDDAAVGGAHLQVRPQFTIDYESRALELGVTGGYDFRKYFVEGLTNLDRFRNFNAGLSMGILPQGVVGVNLDSGVQITGRETEAVNSDDALLQQLVSRNEATLSVRPGNAMELQAGGVFEARSITVPEGFVQQPNGAPAKNTDLLPLRSVVEIRAGVEVDKQGSREDPKGRTLMGTPTLRKCIDGTSARRVFSFIFRDRTLDLEFSTEEECRRNLRLFKVLVAEASK